MTQPLEEVAPVSAPAQEQEGWSATSVAIKWMPRFVHFVHVMPHGSVLSPMIDS